MAKPPHVFIVAVETSGDQLGAALISDLRMQHNGIALSGIGGALMSAKGVRSDIDISALSILGFVEALKVYPTVLKKVKAVTAQILSEQPDAVILIDSWGFMIRVAQRLKAKGYNGTIIKYVAPQVWAMREGRAKILARSVDHLLTLHSFDAPYFTRHGLPVDYVGNPVFDTNYGAGNSLAFRDQHNISRETPVIGVLFGSRGGEVARLGNILAHASTTLSRSEPKAVIVAPIASAIKGQVRSMISANPAYQDIKIVPQDHLIDAMAAMNVALAVSGTVTTQLASAGVPTVVAYKLAPVTFFAAKRLFKPDYISIVNIAAGAELMPEFIQNDATPEAIATAAKRYLSDPEFAAQTRAALQDQTLAMQNEGGSASSQAASAILKLCG